MPGDILGVQRGCGRCTRAGSLAHGPDVSLEAVEIKPEFSGVERTDRIADGPVGRRRGVGLVHPVQDVAPARADCELELGGGPAELAVAACGCLDLDPKVASVVIDGLDVVVSPGSRIGSPDHARGVQPELVHSLALDAQNNLLAPSADRAVVLGFLIAARRPGTGPAPATRAWPPALRWTCRRRRPGADQPEIGEVRAWSAGW